MSDLVYAMDGSCRTIEEALRLASARLSYPAIAVIGRKAFGLLTEGARNGPAMASSFPHPGVFLQAEAGWFYVVPDDRVAPDGAIVRDAVSGLYVEVTKLGY